MLWSRSKRGTRSVVRRFVLLPALLSAACTTRPAPLPPAPQPVALPPAFAVATCVDGTVFPSGAAIPQKMGLLGTVLEPTDGRADFVLRGGCALHEALVACQQRNPLEVGKAGPRALVMGLDIDEQGIVVEATRQDGQIEQGPFSECVAEAMRSARFPKGARGKALYRIALAAHVVTIAETGTFISGVPVGETKRLFRGNFPRLRACYEQRLKDVPSTKGLVTFWLTVRADGTFSEVHVDHDDGMENPEMLQCMAAVFSSLRLPSPPTGEAHIRYPLRFATHQEL